MLDFRKPRGDKKGQTLPINPSPPPPPSDPANGGLINTHEPSHNSTPMSSLPFSPSTHETLLYLEPKYAIFTRSLAECNIHDLIRQPTGVDKNEWIANNSTSFNPREEHEKC